MIHFDYLYLGLCIAGMKGEDMEHDHKHKKPHVKDNEAAALLGEDKKATVSITQSDGLSIPISIENKQRKDLLDKHNHHQHCDNDSEFSCGVLAEDKYR